jgi:XTP/dITP diphosphohydrolase
MDRRTARFRCVVALACVGRVIAVADGCVEGLIVDDPRGEEGFGYDPHFLIPDLGLTKAQLPLDRKNQLSHRGIAVRRITPKIREYAAGKSTRSNLDIAGA